MTDKSEEQPRQIDVNSGAAPQPGGWAGMEGAEAGHALPGFDYEVEQKRALDEPLEVSGGSWLQELADSQPQADQNDSSAPVELGSGGSGFEVNDEQKAVNDHALETQAIAPEEEDASDQQGAAADEKPAKKTAAKKATAKKTAKK